MLVLRNKNGAYVEDFTTLEALQQYVKDNELDMKYYFIQDKC